MSAIPTDLIQEILVRSEAELLVRLRRVCKSWNELIKSPAFIKKHLTRIAGSSLIHNRHIIVPKSIHVNGTLLSVDFSSSDLLKKAKTKELRYPMPESLNVVNIVGSCNGIVCLELENKCYTYLEGFILWNPTTGISRRVGYGSGYPATGGSYCYFGYSRKDEYHVIRAWGFSLDSFNVNKDWWTCDTIIIGPGLDPVNERRSKNIERSGHFFRGALHLIARTLSQHIMVSFDPSTNSISRHDLPPMSNQAEMVQLGDSQGSLCVFGWQSQPPKFFLWMMKTDGGRESWKDIVFEGSYGLARVLPYINVEDNDGTQQVLGIFMDSTIKWCDFKNKRVTPIHIEGQLPKAYDALRHACVCLRTLVSPFLV